MGRILTSLGIKDCVWAQSWGLGPSYRWGVFSKESAREITKVFAKRFSRMYRKSGASSHKKRGLSHPKHIGGGRTNRSVKKGRTIAKQICFGENGDQ